MSKPSRIETIYDDVRRILSRLRIIENKLGSSTGNPLQEITVKKAGIAVGTRGAVNFIEGANIAVTVTDDNVNDEVDVTIAAGAFTSATKTNTDYTLTASDYEVRFSTGNTNRTATLPSATGAGRIFVIKKIDSGTGAVIVAAASGHTIDGQASLVLISQNESVMVMDVAASTWDVIE